MSCSAQRIHPDMAIFYLMNGECFLREGDSKSTPLRNLYKEDFFLIPHHLKVPNRYFSTKLIVVLDLEAQDHLLKCVVYQQGLKYLA